MLGIDGALFGSRKHMFLDGEKLSAADVRPGACRWIAAEPDHADPLCVRTLLKLEKDEVDLSPPRRYTVALKALHSDDDPDDAWKLADPSIRRRWAASTLRSTVEKLGSVDPSYQEAVFAPCSEIFRLLQPWRVDVKLRDSDDPEARSCVPREDGWLHPPTYDRFGTRTGRLTVVSGPRVLTVRRSTRELFRPVNDEHALVSIDYASLEARVALALAGKPARANEDPYAVVADKTSAPSREDAKRATFAALYSDPTDARLADPTAASVRRLFKLGETHARLLSETPRNLYGRKLDATPETMYSNYVQSTGADVVLLGFLELLGRPETRSLVPHFLLHDALFASIPKTFLEPLKEICAAGVEAPRLGCVLPLAVAEVGGEG